MPVVRSPAPRRGLRHVMGELTRVPWRLRRAGRGRRTRVFVAGGALLILLTALLTLHLANASESLVDLVMYSALLPSRSSRSCSWRGSCATGYCAESGWGDSSAASA